MEFVFTVFALVGLSNLLSLVAFIAAINANNRPVKIEITTRKADDSDDWWKGDDTDG